MHLLESLLFSSSSQPFGVATLKGRAHQSNEPSAVCEKRREIPVFAIYLRQKCFRNFPVSNDRARGAFHPGSVVADSKISQNISAADRSQTLVSRVVSHTPPKARLIDVLGLLGLLLQKAAKSY
jgi:hypothetical protein